MPVGAVDSSLASQLPVPSQHTCPCLWRSALSPWDRASCGGHTRNCFGLKGLVELKVLSALNLIYSQRSSDVTCT